MTTSRSLDRSDYAGFKSEAGCAGGGARSVVQVQQAKPGSPVRTEATLHALPHPLGFGHFERPLDHRVIDLVGDAFVPKSQAAQRSAKHQWLDAEARRTGTEPGLEFGGGPERMHDLLVALKDLVAHADR